MAEQGRVGPGEVDNLLDDLLSEYVSEQIEAARRAAESCGCASCRETYKKWQEWITMKKIEEEKRATSGENDDGPPDINSGGLADWYAKDL